MAKNPPYIDKSVAKKIAGGWPDNIASVIVRAWSDKDYKKRLLTLPLHPGETHHKARARTQAALAEQKVVIPEPVVLTNIRFKTYKPKGKEAVLVLPEALGEGSLSDAKELMLLHCLGV